MRVSVLCPRRTRQRRGWGGDSVETVLAGYRQRTLADVNVSMSGGPTIAVSCQGLVKHYADVVAVAGLDLGVRAGECFGLLGPNGAGKTTTIEILEGLLVPDRGTVRIFGHAWGDGDDALRQRLGIHLQESQLDEKLSVAETLGLFRAFYANGRTVDEVLDLFELGSKAASWVGKLSGGQRQRLAIGCALVGDPDLLFLDEPTTGLDPQARRQLWSILERFRADGGTIVLTTHYMDEAEVLCDRVAIVDKGRVIAEGTPDELIASIGAAHIVRFTLRSEAADDPAGLASALDALPDVDTVRHESEAWVLTATALQRTIPSLVRLAAGTRHELDSLTTRTATLEDVFVSLTGRHLRDD